MDDNIIVLNDEDGNEVKFEFLDLIPYQGKEYVVLLPNDHEADEVVILELEECSDDTENYLPVEDEGVVAAVFDIFKANHKDKFDFIDTKTKNTNTKGHIMEKENNLIKFFASKAGKVAITVASAAIIYGLIIAALSTGAGALFWITAIACGYFGWKALNRITPDIFLFMSIAGWFVYFFIKGMLSVVIGAFVAPFKLGKMVSDYAHRRLNQR